MTLKLPQSPMANPTVWLILGMLVVMYFPTYKLLDEAIWGNVGQGHGPIMLAVTVWLAWERRNRFAALPARSSPALGWSIMVAGMLIFIVGQSQDMLALAVTSQLFVCTALVLLYRGTAGFKAMWFPIFFMLFLIPIPGSLVDQITAPLKMGVSHVAENIMYYAGYPIGRSGVILNIGPYQLLVADACAGLNSIFALEAVGVVYLSIMNYKSKARNIAIALSILPISFVSNVIRVVALVLITYYFGDEVGQGFVHGFAGVLLFMLATLFTIGLDSVLNVFMSSERNEPDQPSLKEIKS